MVGAPAGIARSCQIAVDARTSPAPGAAVTALIASSSVSGEPGPASTVSWDDFAQIDIRVGRIVEVAEFPEARRPAWKLRIDFGPEIGMRWSSAQITNYPRAELEDRLVLAVVNFPPRQVGPFRSEVLTLGTYSGAAVLLVAPDPGAQPGDRLG
jgi:tRNA-binding protein